MMRISHVSLLRSTAKKRIFRFLFFVCVLFLFIGVFIKLPLLYVSNIECHVDGTQSCVEGVTEELDQYKGKHILFVNTHVSEEKIINAVKYLETVRVKKIFPNTLRVELITKQPTCYVQNETGQKVFSVDESGYIYGIHDDKKNIVLMYPNDYQLFIGQTIPKETANICQVLSKSLVTFSKTVTSFRFFSDSDIRISFEDGTKAIMRNSNPQEQLSTLQRILDNDTIETQSKTIDVRFDHPVIQ